MRDVRFSAKARSMRSRLNGKVAVVTGAGRGIGREIALGLAREGARVVVNDLPNGVRPSEFAPIEGGDAEETARAIGADGGEAIAFPCSVADHAAAEELVRTAVRRFGGLHILVNNAGILTCGKPWEISEAEWDEACNTCLKGAWSCIRHAAGPMKDQGWGRIVNCSSISAFGTAGAVAYGAAKAGMIGLTDCVAWDMRPYDVTCNAILPQARQSLPERELQDQAMFRSRLDRGQLSRSEYERMRNRPGAEAVAPFVVYLATDEAAAITGELFFVRGGVVSRYAGPEPRQTIVKSDNPDEGVWTLDELIARAPGLLS